MNVVIWTGLLMATMVSSLVAWPFYVLRNFHRLMLRERLFAAGTLFLVADQLSKWAAVVRLKGNPSVPVIRGFFSLTYVENTGAAFGLFKGQQGMFIAMAVLTVFIILFYLSLTEEDEWMIRSALVLILAGAVGNLIDRIAFGYVIDFFHLHYKSFSWPVFNLADVCIDVGVGLILIDVIRDFCRPSEGRDAATEG